MSATQVFEHQRRVAANDCTVGNHVYYSRYLDWLEAGRNDLMRAIGHPFPALMEGGILLPAIEAQIRYRGAARFDDRITVRLWIQEVSRIKITFAADIVNADTGKTLVSATTTHVCTDHADKPHRLPPSLLQALATHVRVEFA
jgi:acyl-CoA thioester hydrolase